MAATLSPEGLTFQQERLAGLLFDTKINAPVNRRKVLPGGGFSFYKIERLTSPVDFAQEGEFALKLHEKQPDAPLSPVYINLRNLPEQVLDQVGVAMAEIPTGERPDVVTGIPTAGTPLAKAYGRHSGIPVVEILGKEQTDIGRRIVSTGEGSISGQRLRIIDDLATKGDTKIEALRAAEQMGYRVVDLVVLVDRQQGAVDQLKQVGYTLRSALTIDQLLRYGVRTDRITPLQYDQVAEYLNLR